MLVLDIPVEKGHEVAQGIIMQKSPKLDSDLIPMSPNILTKKLEVSVVVPESERDVLRVAGVLNSCGLPHVGFHYSVTIYRGRELI